MYKDNNQPFAKCWAHKCENTATELVQSTAKSFNLIWYCKKDSRAFRRSEYSAKVIVRLKLDGNGHMTVVKRERSRHE